MDEHNKSQGKKVAKLIFTHSEIMQSLPKYVGTDKKLFAGYVGSYEVMKQGNENPVITKSDNIFCEDLNGNVI